MPSAHAQQQRRRRQLGRVWVLMTRIAAYVGGASFPSSSRKLFQRRDVDDSGDAGRFLPCRLIRLMQKHSNMDLFYFNRVQP